MEVVVVFFSAVVSTERPRVAGTSPVWVSPPGSSDWAALHWKPVWGELWSPHLSRHNNININKTLETADVTSAGGWWGLPVSVSEEIVDRLTFRGGGADDGGEQEEGDKQWQQLLGNNWSLKLPPHNILLLQLSGFCFTIQAAALCRLCGNWIKISFKS